MTGLMSGKRGLIMGLANDKSLAWGIAKQQITHPQGVDVSGPGGRDAIPRKARPAKILHGGHRTRVANLQPRYTGLVCGGRGITDVSHAVGLCARGWVSGSIHRVRPLAAAERRLVHWLKPHAITRL